MRALRKSLRPKRLDLDLTTLRRYGTLMYDILATQVNSVKTL